MRTQDARPRSLVTPELCRVCRLSREPAAEAFRPFAAAGQSGPCFYLGKELGLRECKRCRGSVRQKTFACGHPLHGEAVLRECRSCPDYEPLLAAGGVKTWAVGLTTAPREEPTLARCLDSLAAAVGTRPSCLPNRKRSCPSVLAPWSWSAAPLL